MRENVLTWFNLDSICADEVLLVENANMNTCVMPICSSQCVWCQLQNSSTVLNMELLIGETKFANGKLVFNANNFLKINATLTTAHFAVCN